ncbi:MAG: hypothetical protein ACREML_02665, partial [Vulcanimicrobiaceae bacterium]
MIVRELVWKSDPRDSRLRSPYFAERVQFDLALATGIARAVEDRFPELFGTRIPVVVFPPVRLDPEVWMRLCDDGLAFDVSAACGDLTFVASRKAALKVVACAFGETTPAHGERTLSSIEV